MPKSLSTVAAKPLAVLSIDAPVVIVQPALGCIVTSVVTAPSVAVVKLIVDVSPIRGIPVLASVALTSTVNVIGELGSVLLRLEYIQSANTCRSDRPCHS